MGALQAALLLGAVGIALQIFSPSSLRSLWSSEPPKARPGHSLTVDQAQPDQVRKTMPAARPTDREMRCFDEIGPSSVVTTEGVEIFTESFYMGARGGQHTWKYKVNFKNTGQHQKVQMLTRHWVFTDAKGRVNEVKGPGARGSTPVLEAGEEWSYESGTSLETSSGSMTGSFQFDILSHGGGSFSGRVGRLALTPDREAKKVPCGEEAEGKGTLPSTSVRSTRRVIIGAISEFLPNAGSDDEGQRFAWRYDVQVNNARDVPVTLLAHHWDVRDLDGHLVHTQEGKGAYPRSGQSTVLQVDADDAIRFQGILHSNTTRNTASGWLEVKLGDETFSAGIGILGLSEKDEPVPFPKDSAV